MKRLKDLLLRSSVALMLLMGVVACKAKADDQGGGEPPKPSSPQLSLVNNQESIDFKSAVETRTVSVRSTVQGWRVREVTDVDWLTVTREANAIKLILTENTGPDVREASIELIGEGLKTILRVRQLGATPQILLSSTVISLPVSGGPVNFIVTTNVKDFEVKLPEWITENTARAAMREVSHSFLAKPNQQEELRTANIEIVEKNPDAGREAVKALVAVSQKGLSSYTAQGVDKLPKDIKLSIASGTDTSHQDNTSDISKAFDGNMSTIYHSRWDNSPANYFPITLTLNLAEASDVDYMIYHPRQEGYNGHFKVVDIEYSTDGSTFQKVMTKDFKGSGIATRVVFEEPLKNVKSFRLIVKSGHGDGKGFAAAAEIEFYKKNPQSFDYTTLFKDEVCSELKDNLTEQEILRAPDEFFRNLAYFMYKKKYSKEFRVAEYKAWPNPYNHLKTNKMQYAYSMIDNPTGIAVEAGEEVVVMVGDMHGHEGLALRVVDFYQNGTGDGIYAQKNYPLVRGINRIKMSAKGLVYVLYIKETIEQADKAQPIKIHIASGTVNGYYDSQDDNLKNRYTELLSKATHQYFDIMGLKSHIVFPTEVFREVTKDGKDLADLYDQIVHAEQELHGLVKYKRTYKNRMLLCPTYKNGAYMYATNEHTAYSPGTLKAIANPETLRNSVWGPAHEIGHIHQTPPAVLWQGMTECTVNIPSAYVQTTILGKECRLQVEKMGNHGMTRYTNAFSQIIGQGIPHGEHTDVFCKLVPFWQLELYFGKVLGNTPTQKEDKDGFYPQLYEYARQNQAPTRTEAGEYYNGRNQIEFAYIASKVSGYDLTDFFTKWGFLKPIDKIVDDYDKEPLKVTQQQIDEVKKRIADLKLTKLDVALEYITDRTVEQFKTKAEVVKGTVTRNGNVITLNNWKNVVAIVVEDANNRVICIGDGTKTDGSKYAEGYILDLSSQGQTWNSAYKVYAVSAKGEKTLVTGIQ